MTTAEMVAQFHRVFGLPVADMPGPDDRPVMRADGKVLKPEGWHPPRIKEVLGLA